MHNNNPVSVKTLQLAFEARLLAVCMGSHNRLGSGSNIRMLDLNLLRIILQQGEDAGIFETYFLNQEIELAAEVAHVAHVADA